MTDQIPDTINWDHVCDDIICMARDSSGAVYGYIEPALLRKYGWWAGGKSASRRLESHKSLKIGTVDWKDSLVYRPGHEPEESQ